MRKPDLQPINPRTPSEIGKLFRGCLVPAVIIGFIAVIQLSGGCESKLQLDDKNISPGQQGLELPQDVINEIFDHENQLSSIEPSGVIFTR